MNLLLLYWLQVLINTEWKWFDFAKCVVIPFVNAGNYISAGAVTILDTTFEFKYIIALFLMLIIFCLLIYMIKLTDYFIELYYAGRSKIKKIQEDIFNKQLTDDLKQRQMNINDYKIYLKIEPRFDYARYCNIDFADLKKQINTSLIKQTKCIPDVIQDRFVYSFNEFEKIDKVLSVFFNLLHSGAPVDYYIIVCVSYADSDKMHINLQKLTGLNIKNRIIMLSDVNLRYGYNRERLYNTSIAGIFYKAGTSYEVYQFVETNKTDKNLRK